MVYGLIYISHKIFLPIPIGKRKLQLSDRFLSSLSPLELKFRPFPVLFHHVPKPILQLRKHIVIMEIFDLLRVNIAIGHTHPYAFQFIFFRIYIGITFCLGQMYTDCFFQFRQFLICSFYLIHRHRIFCFRRFLPILIRKEY